MVYCHECGKENNESADFCFSCGTKISPDDEDSFYKRIDEWGEEIGRSAERFGKKVEEVAKRVHDRVIGTKKRIDEKLKENDLKRNIKYCIKCGTKYYGKPNYCNKCGNKI